MPLTVTEVRPGDLITAEFWNLLLSRIGELESKLQQVSGTTPSGNIVVPNLFGRTLADAKAISTQPSLQLMVGTVLDVFGAVVNQNVPASGKLLVLFQLPAPGTPTTPGASLSLVVSGTASTGTGTVPTPTKPIVKGVSPDPAPVGTQVQVLGANFLSTPKDNTVLIGGKAAQVITTGSSTTALVVKVPTDIPGAPTKPTDQPLKDVSVVVRHPDGAEGSGKCNIGPPPALPKAAIASITPDMGTVGKAVTIAGTNFGETIPENEVFFDGVAATITNAKGGMELIVTVPTGIPGVEPGNIRENVPVTVKVKSQEKASDAFGLPIFQKGT